MGILLCFMTHNFSFFNKLGNKMDAQNQHSSVSFFFFAFLPIRTLEHKVPGYSTQAVMGFSKFILGFSLKIWHS